MPAKEVPVNAKVLAWAMNEAGVDDAGLAQLVKVSPEAVASWRTGEERPPTGAFRRIAHTLNRPTVFFLQSQPPKQASSTTSFRRHAAARELSAGRAFLREEDKALRLAKRFQKVIAWLRSGEPEGSTTALPSYKGSRPATERARQFEVFIGWSTADQLAAPTASRVFADLRRSLESRGLLVIVQPMKRTGCRGFALHDRVAPLVAVNSAQTMEARVFTLLHETAHIVRGQNAFDVYLSASSDDERWCEQFAAAFLMPEQNVREYVGKKLKFVNDLKQARQVANKFHVSLTASCIRLAELGLAPTTLIAGIPKYDNLKPEGKGGFSDDPSTAGKRLRELGLGVIGPIMEAEESGALRRHDVQRYLDLQDDKYEELSVRVRGENSVIAEYEAG